MPAEIRSDSTLPIDDSRRARTGCERRREIQMQTRVDGVLERDRCRAIGVFHEDHGAHGRYSLLSHAVQDAPGSLGITPPIVGIHDQEAALRRRADRWRAHQCRREPETH